MTNPKENKEKCNQFIEELDKLLKKHKVTLYGEHIGSNEETTIICGFSSGVFDTGLKNIDYGKFY